MKTMELIAEVGRKIDNILDGRKQELLSLDEAIAKENEEITAANARMESATTSGDVAGYKAAKADRANALDEKEMYMARLDAMQNRPLISKADYERELSGIFAAVAAAEGDTKKTLCHLSDEMAAAASELEEITHAANAVLQRLQHDLYRDEDKTKNPKTGEPLGLAHEERRVKTWDTIHWGRAGITHAQYREYTGRKA